MYCFKKGGGFRQKTPKNAKLTWTGGVIFLSITGCWRNWPLESFFFALVTTLAGPFFALGVCTRLSGNVVDTRIKVGRQTTNYSSQERALDPESGDSRGQKASLSSAPSQGRNAKPTDNPTSYIYHTYSHIFLSPFLCVRAYIYTKNHPLKHFLVSCLYELFQRNVNITKHIGDYK